MAEAALLVAARMVRYLGAGRRRGRGECGIHLQGVTGWPVKQGAAKPDEKALLALFERYWLSNQPLADIEMPRAIELPALQRTGQPLRLVLMTRTDEPVLISQRAEAGNQFEDLGYVPGFVLRGAFASLLATHHDLNDVVLHQTFARLFFRDTVRFSPLLLAYEEPTSGGSLDYLYPAVPAPQDLFVGELHPGRGKLIDGYTVGRVS